MCTFKKESLIALQLEKEFWKTIYEHAYISLYWYIYTYQIYNGFFVISSTDLHWNSSCWSNFGQGKDL